MNILGLSAFYHDSAAAILQNGKIIAAAQEERFTRIKNDPSFPQNAARFCLHYAGLSLSEVDAVVFYDKPLLKFERLLETYYAFAPKGWRSFVNAMPVWMKEKMFMKKLLKDELQQLQPGIKKLPRILFPEHHLSHAASAFYPSSYTEAAILTIDGVGEWATASICHGRNNQITLIKELRFPHSLGLLYSAFTYFLGFEVNEGEYKLMGLAPYGNPDAIEVQQYEQKITSELAAIAPDGSLWLNQQYFNYATGLEMVNNRLWKNLFGFERRNPDAPIEQQHCNLALAIQRVTEQVVLAMAAEAKRLTGSQNLCMAGGVALNCVANGKLLKTGLFQNLYIQPAAGDAGGALGAALAAYHIGFNQPRTFIAEEDFDAMQGAYLGPEFSELDIQQTARTFKLPFTRFDDVTQLAGRVAQLIAGGNAVGWFQGRMEYGPRALGNRSILGDARNPEMQKKLNLKIKYRESFRPFAPSVLEEDCNTYFELSSPSPYMLLVANVQNRFRNALPANYHQLLLKDKLYFIRSAIPAVTHIDFSARIQTVSKLTNPQYYQLLAAYKELTGFGVLVNTSFNVRGEPIVCTPDDAVRCFLNTEMDFLAMGNCLFGKKND
ncbi:hypothetical protein C7N43_14530 [Sphingobacteriales bacterium UPWRP_1]|nr:hypothetical protein B6N25_08185 [Sphingobacteriales bacterium TSM_CSS]PSJ76286.1 hypothetical protein C7N43_14530 [Sphingobacteriales bacterium UPWRP_1]